MKKIILHFYFALFTLEVLGQNNITLVKYKVDMNLEDLQLNNKKYNSSQNKAIQSNYENYSELEYTLLFNSNESLFYLSDSIVGLAKDYDKASINKRKIITIEKNKKYYKNLIKNQVIYTTKVSGESLLINSSLNILEWKLLNEKKQIGKYNCYKAILTKGNDLLGYNKNMIITAWYSSELPVPFGPMHFGDLPGLILELQLGRKVYYVDSIKFKNNAIIKPLTEGTPMSLEKYSQFIHSFFDDQFGKKN